MPNIFSTTLTSGNDTFVFAGLDPRIDIPWTIYALAGNDSVTVNGGWKTICDMAEGDDYVRANGGTIVQVDGGSGNDRVDMYGSSVGFTGGDGNDRVNVYGGSHLAFDGGVGADRVDFYFAVAADVSGGANDDIFVSHRAISGTISGDSGNDQFLGFHAGASGLTLAGGAGNDLYRIDDPSIVIAENAGEGTDQIQIAFSYALGANLERLTLIGSANVNGTGNALANTVFGNTGENVLSGGAGDDRLYGFGGADSVNGGDGNDRLEGGTGRDEFTGGAGADSFLFRPGDFAGLTTSTCDVIHDFSHAEGDRIRLNLVDANANMGGDQAFAFIGTSTFHGIAGELRYEQISGNTYIQGDTNGDAIADFWVRIDGPQTLVTGDLVL